MRSVARQGGEPRYSARRTASDRIVALRRHAMPTRTPSAVVNIGSLPGSGADVGGAVRNTPEPEARLTPAGRSNETWPVSA
jgi:hypothetical protein